MKSPVMTACTSGRRRISAVPLVWVRSVGARISALGGGREVRCGFCDRAAWMAFAEEGGVIMWISIDLSVYPD